MTFFAALSVIQVVGTVFGGVLAWLIRDIEIDRSRAVTLGVAWVLLATFEFWGLGPWSYIAIGNELDYGPPLYEFLNRYHDGGTFTHAYAGGNDIYGMAGTGGQYIALERLLVWAFPFWMANAIHKIVFVALSFVGIYKIARHFKMVDRRSAVALAVFYSLAHEMLVETTWFAGFGYAIIPLAVYLVVLRVGRTGYWAGVAAIAVLNAISCEPAHSVMVLLFTLGLASLAQGFKGLRRILAAIGAILAVFLANWHEALYAMSQLAPISARYSLGAKEIGDPAYEWQSLLHFGGGWGVLGLAVIAFVVLTRCDRMTFAWNGGALALATVSGIVFLSLPWGSVGLDRLGAINFRYLYGALPVIAIIAFVVALPKAGRGGRVLAMALFALGFGHFTWAKAYHGATWLSEGGVALYGERFDRMALNWMPEEPFRTVSVPYRLPLNTAQAMGLESFDGFINLQTSNYKQFWDLGVSDPKRENTARGISDTGNSGLLKGDVFYKCCDSYDIRDIADVNLLRAANIRYVLSVLPLHGDGLRQVSGPAGATRVPRAGQPLADRLLGYAALNFDPAEIRVFEIEGVLPRVFAARCVRQLSADAEIGVVLDAVAKTADDRCVVVAPIENGKLRQTWATLTVTSFQLVKDGFDVEIDAPEDGVVVFNVPYYPYWVAHADGVPMPVVAANLVHTVVPIPQGVRHLTLRYERPLLRDKVM